MFERFATLLIVFSALAAPAAAQLIEVDRSFAVVEDALNRYTVSLPDPVEVPDIANSTQANPCDLSAASPDGVVNADDMICQLWGGGDDAERRGAFLLMRLDEASCRHDVRMGLQLPGGHGIRFVGTPFDYEPTVGYWVHVQAVPGQALPENAVTLRSRCEIDLAPRPVERSCPYALLALPYDAEFLTASDLLCGLRGRDWAPRPDLESAPDQCGHGLFDPVSGASVTVQRLQNEVGFMGRTVYAPGIDPRFLGTDFALVPGEAVVANMEPHYEGSVWEPASVPCP